MPILFRIFNKLILLSILFINSSNIFKYDYSVKEVQRYWFKNKI